jgi:membrane AbrB-like protein
MPWIRMALTLAAAGVAAELCVWLKTPLPWMIGPLVATALLSARGVPTAAWPPLRDAGQLVIGLALGLYFTPPVIALVTGHALAIAVGIVWALLIGAGFSAWLRWWAARGGLQVDRTTAYFSGCIGGASEMVVLAQRHGGQLDLVAACHTLRVLMVVVIVPFGFQFAGLAGIDTALPGPKAVHWGGLLGLLALASAAAWLLARLRLTNPWMIGPLLVALVLTSNNVEWSALPGWLVNAAQLVIGVALGTRFTPAFLHQAPRWMTGVALGTLGLLLVSVGFGLALGWATAFHPATTVLATAPGGIAEMCITAKVLQLGVPIVTAFHVTRMVGVVLLAGPLYQWMVRPAAAGEPA